MYINNNNNNNKRLKSTKEEDQSVEEMLTLLEDFSPVGEWAVPGGTARPGQPVEKSEQAPASSPRSKNQFNIDGPQWGPYQILS